MEPRFTYEHIGQQPIIHKGTWYVCGDLFEATEAEAEFFVLIGAARRVDSPAVVPFNTMKDVE